LSESAAEQGAAPSEEAQALMACCQTLGMQAEPAQIQALMGYLDLLERWNATYNLTAVRERAQMRSQHLADCLAVIPALVRHAALNHGPSPMPLRLLDVGSGGGLPGVVIALFMPHWRVTCVDAVGKKTAFIQQVAGRLGLGNLHALHSRVEDLKADTGMQLVHRAAPRVAPASIPQPIPNPLGEPAGFDVITARAFSSLADLVRLTQHLLAPGGAWVAMKARLEDGELAALAATEEGVNAPDCTLMFHVEPIAVPGLEAQRCLVWMQPGAGAHSAAGCQDPPVQDPPVLNP
jgi:16S rRNA (guanine527-N7)-methyltransferase